MSTQTKAPNSSMVIGYTTGVYDMFHVGHLNLLTRARAACDYLIVGVTTDALAMTRKGLAPIIPQSDRMAIVGALSCVDKVVEQDSMDKMVAWEKLGFHRMFVGDDWKGDPKWIALEGKLSPLGVRIVYFPYTAHVSTTRLRNHVDSDTGV